MEFDNSVLYDLYQILRSVPGCSSHGEDVYTYNFPDDGKRLKYLGMRALDTLCSC